MRARRTASRCRLTGHETSPHYGDGVFQEMLRFLLEGPPKIGKSTAVERLVQLLHQTDIPVGGFITRELREHGRRVGFAVRDIDGPEALLAHQDFRTDVQVGRFYVDVAAFEGVGLPALDSAVEHGGIVVIDEIARMELASPAFVAAVHTVFDSTVPVVATVHVAEHPVTDKLKARTDVERLEVTEANRDDLPAWLYEQLTS